MSHGHIILLVLAAFLFLAFVGWCLVRAGTLGEDDIPVEIIMDRDGRVVRVMSTSTSGVRFTTLADQDGEMTPGRHHWVNAGVKAHHAE